jgi:hypothetical protein
MKYIIDDALVSTIDYILIGQGRHELCAQLHSLKPIEPLTDEQITKATGCHPSIPLWLAVSGIARAIEVAIIGEKS